ncbi:hypothetical protein BK634_13135 [Pseudomonas chlororaphis]|nr:hypothetical protein BK634_13135 [Pseudomonas chlororaphis]
MGGGQRPGKQYLYWFGSTAERITRALQHVVHRFLYGRIQVGRNTHVNDLSEKITLLCRGLGADQRIAAVAKFCPRTFFNCVLRALDPIGATVDLRMGQQCIRDLRRAGAQ